MPVSFSAFNELSCPIGELPATSLLDHLRQLTHTIYNLWQIGIKKIRVTPDFRTRTSKEGESVNDLIFRLERPERQILLQALDSPHIKDNCDPEEENSFITLNVTSINGVSTPHATGILCAYIHNTIIVSLPSSGTWLTSNLNVTIANSIDNSQFDRKIEHISEISHINTHRSFLCRLTIPENSQKDPSPFPNSDQVTKVYARNDWSAFYSCFKNLNQLEKTAKYRKIASDIATANGYTFNARLTSLNSRIRRSLRQIFTRTTDKGDIHLSTDFEKGAFEVCDQDGKHLGEWLFSGEKHKPADSSGFHDIILR